MKRIISLILVACLILGLLAGISFSVFAAPAGAALSTPPTGDKMPVAALVILAVLAAAALILVIIGKNKFSK